MLEPIENQYVMIGQINRSHGIHGEVLIISDHFAPSLFSEVDLVNLRNLRGDMIPARIESVSAQEKGNRVLFFVKFEHITDRNQADAVKGFGVFLEREIAEPMALEKDRNDDYSGWPVYDEEDHEIGTVEEVLDNPAHLILRIVTAGEQRVLVPFVDEYIRSSDSNEKIVRCRNLDQLEEL